MKRLSHELLIKLMAQPHFFGILPNMAAPKICEIALR